MELTIYHLCFLALIYGLQLRSGSCSEENEDNTLPKQLHCLSEVVYRKQERSLGTYVVDEYVDVPNDRSSVKLTDLDDSTTKIYYHQINAPDRPTKSKFIVYDPDMETCQFYQSRDWPLNKIRKTVTQMLPISRLSRELCDLILGPSALLYVIEAGREDYMFIGRKFNEQRLLNVDLYERLVFKDPDLMIKSKMLVIQVQTVAQYSIAATKLTGKNLATAYGEAKPDFLNLKISSVSSKKTRHSGDDCNEDELIISVKYHIVTSMLTGSLVGRELDETDGFDFQRDPFMQSVGIGCWKDVSYKGQKRLSAPRDQISGLYVTTMGYAGVSYVAWDGGRGLLRLDREGRKSIYDLPAKKSYHHGEFVSLEQIQKNTTAKRNKEKSCVVLDLVEDEDNNKKSSSGKIRVLMELDELFGLGLGNRANAIHLGSKTVDHVNYEVYELELFDSIPILMETQDLTQFKSDTRYFMTYYMEEYRVERMGDSLTESSATSIPKYIELHELDKNRDKFLINRLEFLQFSWSLEVEPEDDPEGLDSLFYIESCAQSRSNQVELRFGLRQDIKSSQMLPKRMEPTFRRQKQLIKQTVQGRMVDLIGLSDLNVAQMEVKFLNQQSVDMMVEAKLVELVDGMVDSMRLGFAYFFDLAPDWQKWFLSFKFNRHSLDDCKLDSLMEKSRNILMYCPRTTACVLVQHEAIQSGSSYLWPNEPTLDSSKPPQQNKLLCEVHNFKWTSIPINGEAANLYGKVQRNLFDLTKRGFRVDFEHREKAQAAPEYGSFIGLSFDPTVVSLDELSLAGSMEEDAILNGMRYELVAGTKSHYSSVAVKMIRQAELYADFNPLRYCQQACQLDVQCQSFSLCLRAKKEPIREEDCVLSNLRLTRKLVGDYAEQLRESKNITKVRLEIFIGPQRFELVGQSECSLHPKDFVSSYKLVEKVKLKPKYPNAMNKGTKQLTLDDCAGESYDESVSDPNHLSNFTHCPMSMSCLINSVGSVLAPDLNQKQPCLVYRRSYSQFFQRQSRSHLAIDLAGSKEPTNTMLHTEMRSRNHVTLALFGHVDEEKCAQICLISHIPCLAFDVCKMSSGGNGCFQYSIRSPASGKIDPRLGLLPKELEFYSDGNSAVTAAALSATSGDDNNNNKVKDSPQSQPRSSARIVTNWHCSHHSLWPTYAAIRVAQVVDSDQQQQQQQVVEGTEDGEIEIEIEKQILEDGAEEIIDPAPTKVTEPDSNHPDAEQHHWSLFLFGLVLAGGGLLYSQQVASCTGDLWARYEARRIRRNMGPRISQLALASVDDLDESMATPVSPRVSP